MVIVCKICYYVTVKNRAERSDKWWDSGIIFATSFLEKSSNVVLGAAAS